MYCRICGKEIEDTVIFCKYCGAQTEASPPQNQELSTATYQPSPNPEPEQKPIKKKLHWIFKDRIARVVCTVIILPIVVFIASKFITPPINNPDARLILNATHPYTTVTYEEAFDEYFTSPKWKFIGPNADGDICVEFTGLGLYKDIITETLLQFTINKASKEISCNYFSANDEAMSIPEAEEFVNKIFEPHFIPELANAVPEEILVISDAVYPGTKTTYKQAFEAYFDEPHWEFIEPEGNKDFVADFTGISKQDATKNMRIQLSWSEENQQVYPSWMELNGVELIEALKSKPTLESAEQELVELLTDNEYTQAALYQAYLAEVFAPHFVPELVEAEQQKGNTIYTSFDEALEGVLLETFSAADDISTAEDLPSAYSQDSPNLSLEEKYPPAHTNDLVAIDYIGMTLGEVIAMYGTEFILPEDGWDGARYMYYDCVPYMFFFQPYDNTPSDEDVIISVRTNGPGAWIANDLPVPSSREELRYRLGMPDGADTDSFFVGDCEIYVSWETLEGFVNYVTIKGQQ